MNYPPYPNNPNDAQDQYAQWPQTGQPQQVPQPLPPTQHVPPPRPPTQYAPPPTTEPVRDPYNMTVQNPYALPNPYATLLQTPPPPRSRHQVWRRIFIVLGTCSGSIIACPGLMGLFGVLSGSITSGNSPFTDLVISLVVLSIGVLLVCKSSTSTIGRWITGITAVIAAITAAYGISSHVQGYFGGSTIMLLLAALVFWTTRNRRW